MENQVFLNFDLRFNLRQTRQEKPTIIYAVFVWQGVQHKVNTLLKVYPSQWDNKTQTATISNRLSKLDNHNNFITNRKLTDILSTFINKKKYLCNEIGTDIVKEVAIAINPKNRKRNMKEKKTKITDVLNGMAYQHQDKSVEQYLFSVKTLKKYLDKEGIDDEISNLNGELLNKFQQSLVGEDKAIKTISTYIRNLKTLINYANKDKSLNIKIDITELEILKDKRKKEEKKSKQVPLSEDQLVTIYNLQDLTGREEEARDLFICQSLLGQRISDMPKIFKGDYTTNHHEDGLETISFNVQKTGEEATLFLFPIAKEIIQKYRDKKFKHFNLFETDEKKITNIERMINAVLKNVCKKAGLTSEINYTVQIGDKVKHERKPLYELMHTHIARHTFITLMCKNGVEKDVVIIATAHTDTNMINEVYLHETASDKGEKLIKSLQNSKHNSALFHIDKPNVNNDLLNKLFAYDSFTHIIELMNNNNDVFHLDSTKQAIKVMKDISMLNNYSKDANVCKATELEQVIFELSYYFHDTLLYSVFKHKEHYFGMEVDVPCTEEVEIMFAQEDIERPKKQQQAELEDWENRY